MSFKKTISILGSTGSIGSNTVDVINSDKKKFSVFSLTSKNNINLLSKQSILLKPKVVAIQNKKKYKDLKNNLFGIDRVVPIGKALDMNLIWDGYDVINSLSRIITLE